MSAELQDRFLKLQSELGNLLVESASEGNLSLVKELVENLRVHVDVDHKLTPGLTALHLASQNGRLDIVKWLLQKNVNLEITDHRGRAAVYHAVKGCQPEVLAMLVKRGANLDILTNTKGFSPLHESASKQHDACFKILIDGNCNANMKDENGDTPLHIAVRKRMSEEFTTLVHALILGNKVDLSILNKKGFNLFHESILVGNFKFIEFLLQLRRDDILLEPIGGSGLNVFHLLSQHGHTPIAELFLDYIKIRIMDASLEPTIISCLSNAKIISGQTPLMLACSQHIYSMIEFLVVKAEADINILDQHGNTAISYVLIGMESGIMKIPTKSESVDSEIFDIYFELNEWDSETMTKYPCLASVCFLLCAGGCLHHEADGLGKMIDAMRITTLLECYVSKYKLNLNGYVEK